MFAICRLSYFQKVNLIVMKFDSTTHLNDLTTHSQQIFAEHQVRKTKAQKQAFIQQATALLKEAGWDVTLQQKGRIVKSNNIIAGDIETAKLVLTAHYDTPARLPFPNFLAPRNIVASLVYQLLLAFVFAILLIAATVGLSFLELPIFAVFFSIYAIGITIIVLILAGPANKNNANDNTSGILTLFEIALAIPEEHRQNVALVFFDNEELGLLGSSQLSREYRRLPNALLLNFDCVGDGDNLLFILPRTCRKDAQLISQLQTAFAPPAGKSLLVDTSPLTFFPSDQLHFKRGIGAATLQKSPIIGLFVARIHTSKDTRLQADNLLWLRDGCMSMAQSLHASISQF